MPSVLALLAQSLVPALLGATATVVVLASPRAPANRFFAVFLGLVVANQVTGLAFTGELLGHREAWRRLGYVLVALDSLFLLYFVSIFPRRGRLNSWRFLAPWVVTSAALAGFAAVGPRGPEILDIGFTVVGGSYVALRLAVTSFMLLAYFVAFAAFSRAWARTSDETQQKWLNPLFVALAAVIATRVALLPVDLQLGHFFGTLHQDTFIGQRVSQAAFLLVGMGALWAVSARGEGARRHKHSARVWRWTWLAVGLVWLLWLVVAGLGEAPMGPRLREFFDGLTTAGFSYSARWLVFAPLVGYAILRGQVFDLNLQLKRGLVAVQALAIMALAASFVVVAAGFLPAARSMVVPVHLFVAGILLAAGATPLVRASRRLADRLLPHITRDESYLRARRLEIYRARLEAVLQEGGMAGDAHLQREKTRLGVTDWEHDRLVASLLRPVDPARGDRLILGTRLGERYEVVDLLGEGGSSRVVLATNGTTRGVVAIKELRHAGLDSRTHAHLLREALVMGRLRHANVLTLLSVEEWRGRTLLVIEYAPGGSLKDLLRMRGVMSLTEAARIMDGLLAGLAAAHAQGIVHRDIKPGNVLLGAGETPKLADFGLAHVPDADATMTSLSGGIPGGTILYASPEQLSGGPVDERTDVYAACIVAFEMLTGRSVFDAGGTDVDLRAAVMQGRVQLDHPAVPHDLRPVLARGLARDASERYRSASELREALDSAFQRAMSAQATSGT